MQTTLEEAAKHTVRLSVEVAPDEFSRDLDRAYRKVAGEVKIPGFRKGKVPKRIIDARIGREAVLQEFIEEFVPAYYLRAIREHDLAPIADPEIDLEVQDLLDGKPLRFTATVEVRPRLTLRPEQYRGLPVEAPSAEPTEREVDAFVDRLRERFAELEVVSRPARPGDYVLADVRAYRHEREIPQATRVGFLSEVGSQDLVPELDRELEGKRKGDILKFNATLPESFGEVAGSEVSFQVLVKEVKAKKLPVADEEFARTASEFDTLAELRDDIRSKLSTIKEAESRAVLRDLALHKALESVDVELPDRLVDEETERRVQTATERAERSGTTLEAALQAQGWDELRFRSDARSHAVRALKADLVLEAVSRQESLRVEPEELDGEVRGLAQEMGRDPKEVRRLLERSGQIVTLAGDIIRAKALDLIVESANVTSMETSGAAKPELQRPREEGNPDE
ncbi:MAG: trigger factor [Actinobacteria bacterium]|nr:trigger factor [Actinomycetota bacterium]